MAGHINYPPAGSQKFVRGDLAAFVLRVRYGGVDQDITTWTWRSHVRSKWDTPTPTSVCEDFEVVTPDDLPGVFAEPGSTPCVLVCHWTPDQTALWQDSYVADIEELTPIKKTWVLIDKLLVDKDASYAEGLP